MNNIEVLDVPSYIFKYIGTSYSCYTDIKLDGYTVVMANKAQLPSFFFFLYMIPGTIKEALTSIWNCSSKYILLASVIKPRSLKSVTIAIFVQSALMQGASLCASSSSSSSEDPLTWHDLLEYFWKCKYKMKTYCPGYQIWF